MKFDNLLPPLATAEFDALKASIKADGVRDPVIVDEDGNVIDGHHRLKIDPDAKRRVVRGLSDAEKQALAFQCNLARRNLSADQRREVLSKMKSVAVSLKKEGRTQKEIAVRLGVAAGTVADWFAPAGSNLGGKNTSGPLPDVRVKVPKREYRNVATRAESKGRKQAAADYGVSERQVGNIIRSVERDEEKDAAKNKDMPASAGLVDVRHCSMAELLQSGIKPDWIITDPPYPEEFLPLYEELARLSTSVPGVAVMCGQSYLPQIYAAMAKHLKYRWTMAYLTPGGQAVQIWPSKVNTFWKPVLLFGDSDKWIGDVCKSDTNDNDKRHHGWGQSETGMADLVERLTEPGHLICDPFVGGGTTAVVSIRLGRGFVGCDTDVKCVEKTVARCNSNA